MGGGLSVGGGDWWKIAGRSRAILCAWAHDAPTVCRMLRWLCCDLIGFTVCQAFSQPCCQLHPMVLTLLCTGPPMCTRPLLL